MGGKPGYNIVILY